MGIKWKNAYLTGILKIDDQHKTLVRYCDDAFTAASRPMDESGRESVHTILKGLQHYTVEHFQYEETLMANHHFSGQDTHLQEHQFFIDRINAYNAQIQQSATTETVVDMVEFLIGWISDHILVSDKKYVKEFSGSRIGNEADE